MNNRNQTGFFPKLLHAALKGAGSVLYFLGAFAVDSRARHRKHK